MSVKERAYNGLYYRKVRSGNCKSPEVSENNNEWHKEAARLQVVRLKTYCQW